MLKFNVEDRVGTIVIERASEGNAFTGEIVRQLGEIIRRAVEEADIVTLAGAGADFTIGRDRHKPKSSPFDAFRNISALNKAIAEFPGVLITGVRGRAFGLGVGLIEHLPAKRALDFILMGVNSALTTRWIGLISRVVRLDDFDGTVGEFVAMLRSRDRRVVPACKRYLRAVGKCRPRPARLTRSWNRRNLPSATLSSAES